MQFHFRCKRIAFDTLDICFPIRREVILSNCKAVANSSLSASDNRVSNLPMPIFVIKSTHLYNNTKKIERLSFHNAEEISVSINSDANDVSVSRIILSSSFTNPSKLILPYQTVDLSITALQYERVLLIFTVTPKDRR